MIAMFRKLLAFLVCGVLVLACSGCSLGMDVETLLCPPQSIGEQQNIQKALEEYIKSDKSDDTPGVPAGYVLKYPKSGEYRSAFILKDLDGDYIKEAIVFYRRGPENSNLHLNLLRKINSNWKSISDIQGASTDVERVSFGDLDGDGILEIMTGWNISNVRERQLVLYKVKNGGFREWYKMLYTDFVVGNMTNCGHDNLMLLHANVSENIATADLWTAMNDSVTQETVLVEMGSTKLDGFIQQFGTSKIGKLTDTMFGVYVDGIKTSGVMVTELIYWDGEQLCSPFYEPEQNANTRTYREAQIPCTDVDEDGVVEWPYTRPPDGYENYAEDKIWQTEWRSWNYDSQAVAIEFSCIMNMTDGYYLRIEDEMKGLFTVSYDKSLHLLKLLLTEGDEAGKELLAIRTVYASTLGGSSTTSQPYVDPLGYETIYELDDVNYMVKYSKDTLFRLDKELISKMFTCIKIK